MAGVFISHIMDEAPVADALKAYLTRYFGPSLEAGWDFQCPLSYGAKKKRRLGLGRRLCPISR